MIIRFITHTEGSSTINPHTIHNPHPKELTNLNHLPSKVNESKTTQVAIQLNISTIFSVYYKL